MKKGFTLIEVLVAATVVLLCLCGLLLTYVNLFFLTDLSRDFTRANSALQAKMEEIKKTNFDSLSTLNGQVFDIVGFSSSTAKGQVAVANTVYSDLKRVRVVVCFKSRQRLVGEDKNLNGILEASEDINRNGRIDSPAEVVTLFSK